MILCTAVVVVNLNLNAGGVRGKWTWRVGSDDPVEQDRSGNSKWDFC